MRVPLTLLLLLPIAEPALGTDGVLEINQACAVNTGCFAGDTAGFPVTIGSPGRYRLTGDLDSSSSFGIQITAAHVSLDLNGFAITSASAAVVVAGGADTSSRCGMEL
jgi:hypothetical protein